MAPPHRSHTFHARINLILPDESGVQYIRTEDRHYLEQRTPSYLPELMIVLVEENPTVVEQYFLPRSVLQSYLSNLPEQFDRTLGGVRLLIENNYFVITSASDKRCQRRYIRSLHALSLKRAADDHVKCPNSPGYFHLIDDAVHDTTICPNSASHIQDSLFSSPVLFSDTFTRPSFGVAHSSPCSIKYRPNVNSVNNCSSDLFD